MKTRYMILLYVLAMVIANTLVWWFGKWSSPFIAFFLIGFDLTMRDVLHERLSRWQMLGVICLGGVVTLIINPAAQFIAIASAAAFAAAAVADYIVYSSLRHKPWMVRANGSNLAGAAVDSLVFPTIAFGALMPHIVLLQFAAKVAGGYLWSLALRRVAAA